MAPAPAAATTAPQASAVRCALRRCHPTYGPVASADTGGRLLDFWRTGQLRPAPLHDCTPAPRPVSNAPTTHTVFLYCHICAPNLLFKLHATRLSPHSTNPCCASRGEPPQQGQLGCYGAVLAPLSTTRIAALPATQSRCQKRPAQHTLPGAWPACALYTRARWLRAAVARNVAFACALQHRLSLDRASGVLSSARCAVARLRPTLHMNTTSTDARPRATPCLPLPPRAGHSCLVQTACTTSCSAGVQCCELIPGPPCAINPALPTSEHGVCLLRWRCFLAPARSR